MKFFNHDLDFNFRNLERKQIILIVSIIVAIIILITVVCIFAINSHKKALSFGKNLGENKLFTGKNDSVKVTISKNYKLKQYNTYLDYLLELRNDNNLNIFVKKLDNSLNKVTTKKYSTKLNLTIKKTKKSHQKKIRTISVWL